MLFNSYFYLLAFLPLAILMVSMTKSTQVRLSLVCLLSLLFYAHWDYRYLPLLVLSILANYAIGLGLRGEKHRKKLLWLGLGFNLVTLGAFKYLGFLSGIATNLAGTPRLTDFVLPLALSFFTFQQISYIVDVYRQEVVERSLLRYTYYVAFFPQLIAGPIVRAKQMLPQIPGSPSWRLAGMGLTFLAIGLIKKVIFADNLVADEVFRYAAMGKALTIMDASVGSLVYGLHIYFDFSGYTDMALGSAMLLGITLPLNFNSPYKATSVQDFWRRWHMTLSSFLRDYLYIPLGGNRGPTWLRGRNVLLVMLLGGLWHGADWTFVIWGGVHAVGILVGHWSSKLSWLRIPKPLAILMTFAFVTLAWIPFACRDIDALATYLQAFANWSGFLYFAPSAQVIGWLVAGLLVVFAGPNSQTIVKGAESFWQLRPTMLWSATVALALFVSLVFLYRTDQFIYFQF